MINSKEFWLGAGERLLKTFLQAFVAALGVSVGGDVLGVTDLNWLGALNVGALAAILSLATSLGNARFTAGTPAPEAEARRVDLEPPV